MTGGLALLGMRLEYLTAWQAGLLFAIPVAIVVALGMKSLAGLGPVRKWVAVGTRVALIGLLVLIVGGLRMERRAEDVEVIVVRDISLSTARVGGYPGPSLPASLDKFVADVSKTKQGSDRIGVVSFAQQALIEAMPNKTLLQGASVVRDVGSGTDIGAAIQLALATFGEGAMRRMVLVTDGNNTTGDLDSAINLAASQKIPIDVIPLTYDNKGEVLVDRMSTPTWRRENEPFTMDIVLRSTDPNPVTGKLTVLHQNVPMILGDKGETFRRVTLNPGTNVERIRVPALKRAGTHEFKSVFEPDDPSKGGISIQSPTPGQGGGVAAGGANGAGAGGGSGAMSSALLANRTATSFTFVRGRGEILYVDNVPGGSGRLLRDALEREGIAINEQNVISPGAFPTSLLQLQDYDAIILANVPRGLGGLSEEQQANLAAYVHELGGGLVVIGGELAFGAGGWAGSRLEQILPVDMDVPSRREIAKGALVMNMHSCEMPDGNYWGEQCAIKAVEALSSRDEIGVLSFAWRGAGGGGSQWDFPLQPKGDGGKAIAAIKQMQLGDMPSFEDSFGVALSGRGGNPGLKDSDARQKHMIVISDGDPTPPSEGLYQAYADAKVTVSTVSVFPHDRSDQGLPPTMRTIANRLKGRAYGPINDNPQQLPQIFIKEATVVKRSLIQEDAKGIPLKQAPALTDAIKGISVPGSVTGFVLTSRKQSPQVEVPIVAGKENDPVLAFWQTGLGRSIVFTSDAHNRWAASWYASPVFDRFWAQVVRAVARPLMNAELDVQTIQTGEKGKIIVEAAKGEGSFESFLNIRGSVVGPDAQPKEIRLVQTAPGIYEAEFDTPMQGNYVIGLSYSAPNGKSGTVRSGLSKSASAELRDLTSKDSVIRMIADRTGGRVLPAFQPASNDWFTRAGLEPKISPLPVWEWLVLLALAFLLTDVAIRRIALDKAMLVSWKNNVLGYIQGFTHTTRQDVDRSQQALGTLRKKREEVQQGATATGTGYAPPPPPPQVEGDLSDLVGGASATDTSTKRDEPGGKKPEAPADVSGGLLAAKRRAQQKIEEKKKEEK